MKRLLRVRNSKTCPTALRLGLFIIGGGRVQKLRYTTVANDTYVCCAEFTRALTTVFMRPALFAVHLRVSTTITRTANAQKT